MAEPDKYKNPSRNAAGGSELTAGTPEQGAAAFRAQQGAEGKASTDLMERQAANIARMGAGADTDRKKAAYQAAKEDFIGRYGSKGSSVLNRFISMSRDETSSPK
jgi:hypothetical protein